MNNMKKALALMLALLMVVALIPFGVVSVAAADDNLMQNGDFEAGKLDGWDAWQNTVISKDAKKNGTYGAHLKGDGGWGGLLDQTIAVEAGKTYLLSFWYKANKSGANFVVKENGNSLTSTWGNAPVWSQVTLEFAATTNSVLLNICGGGTGTAEDIYVDDFILMEKKAGVINGNFEMDTYGWTLNADSKLSTDSHTGKNALYVSAAGAYGEAAYQVVDLAKNTDYVLQWYAKRVSGTGAYCAFLMNEVGFANIKCEGQTWMNETSGKWVKYSISFNSGNVEKMRLKWGPEFANSGAVLVDDIALYKKADAPKPSFDGILYNGDFEIGDISNWENVWGSCSVSMADGRNSGFAMSVDAGLYQIVRQKVTVKPDTDYVIRAYSKDASNMSLLVKDGNDSNNIAQNGFATGDGWKLNSLNFNSGKWSEVYICVMGTDAAAHIVLDDVSVMKKIPASNDGYLVNGTFETGDLTPWDNLWGSCPTAEVISGGKGDNFALKVVSGEWKHVRQTAIKVEKNTNYKITLWAKNVKNMSLLVKDGNDSKDIKNVGIEAGKSWTENVLEFNSGSDTTVIVSLMGNAEEAYGTFDNIKMEKISTVCTHSWKAGKCSLCGAASPSTVTIVTQPTNTYVKEGEIASVKVVAEGEGLKYTWYIKNSGGTKYNKSSITTDTYSVAMSDKAHNRNLICKVSDKYGNTVQAKTVLIRRQATITKEPATVAYAQKGKKASVKITALGDELTYTWYVKNAGASDYAKSSVTSSTYSVSMSDKVKGRRVYCIVKDKYGKKVQSKTFLLREAVSIPTEPAQKQVFKKGETVKITVKGSGDGLKYTWYIKNAGGKSYSKSSITTDTYTVAMSDKVNGRRVYCIITDKYGNTVQSETKIIKYPA